ncbi:MAG: saccharopine dehydrogenase [marine bacterium B5-7]|nr:MAG: saccharopine dehydrogenase [marine bacterium B5-7]
MTDTTLIWLRAESKTGEHRAPLTPSDAARLVELGFDIRVEESEQRVFEDTAFAAAGCRLETSGSWRDAPDHAFILGIKELPDESEPLRHRHIYFGHAYKGQPGWKDLLNRFESGSGVLLDLEYLTDESGRRLAAFGFWAGFAGAALGVRLWAGRQNEGPDFKLSPQRPAANQQNLLATIKTRLGKIPEDRARAPKAIVIGALGRCGRGAVSLFEKLELECTRWDIGETAIGGPFAELIDYDIVVNTVLLNQPIPPFLTPELIERPQRRLGIIADVSCDPGNPGNPLPLYDHVTTFQQAAIRVIDSDNPLDIIAVDHLPSLLPMESSMDFSSQLTPLLETLPDGSDAWHRCEQHYRTHAAEISTS